MSLCSLKVLILPSPLHVIVAAVERETAEERGRGTEITLNSSVSLYSLRTVDRARTTEKRQSCGT